MNAWSFFSALAWPALVAGVIYYFRNELAGLLRRSVAWELFGQKIVTQNVETARLASVVDTHVEPFLRGGMGVPANLVIKNNPVSIYFLSHDLMLAYAALLTRSRRETILQALRSANNHLGALGLVRTDAAGKFSAVLRSIENAKTESELSDDARGTLASELWHVARHVGAVLVASKPRPDSPDLMELSITRRE